MVPRLTCPLKGTIEIEICWSVSPASTVSTNCDAAAFRFGSLLFAFIDPETSSTSVISISDTRCSAVLSAGAVNWSIPIRCMKNVGISARALALTMRAFGLF